MGQKQTGSFWGSLPPFKRLRLGFGVRGFDYHIINVEGKMMSFGQNFDVYTSTREHQCKIFSFSICPMSCGLISLFDLNASVSEAGCWLFGVWCCQLVPLERRSSRACKSVKKLTSRREKPMSQRVAHQKRLRANSLIEALKIDPLFFSRI